MDNEILTMYCIIQEITAYFLLLVIVITVRKSNFQAPVGFFLLVFAFIG
jgi:hypothetical protein